MEQKLFIYLTCNWELINVKDARLTVSMHFLLFRVQICRSICTLCGNCTVNLGESVVVFCVFHVYTQSRTSVSKHGYCVMRERNTNLVKDIFTAKTCKLQDYRWRESSPIRPVLSVEKQISIQNDKIRSTRTRSVEFNSWIARITFYVACTEYSFFYVCEYFLYKFLYSFYIKCAKYLLPKIFWNIQWIRIKRECCINMYM